MELLPLGPRDFFFLKKAPHHFCQQTKLGDIYIYIERERERERERENVVASVLADCIVIPTTCKVSDFLWTEERESVRLLPYRIGKATAAARPALPTATIIGTSNSDYQLWYIWWYCPVSRGGGGGTQPFVFLFDFQLPMNLVRAQPAAYGSEMLSALIRRIYLRFWERQRDIHSAVYTSAWAITTTKPLSPPWHARRQIIINNSYKALFFNQS